ncbi:uncharacterized protein LOC106174122 isoform X2 [Lingula anatina]|uniref:Uncharacterized protein LOC106174122 isoform X2 n=1 Tax=Lingula anatina TaxID=7574 RepID=A0A1S3JM35_LINAN|nr:uncharacterized protein LOC106174122 isoform X2 [Lingula anatina]|eukprot:XP_013410974.1 uncharacterized protein LOC106174122 isoform X2 [Lingula anatina]
MNVIVHHWKTQAKDNLIPVGAMAEFSQKIAAVHTQFASQMQASVEMFKKRSHELRESSVEMPSIMQTTWEDLIREVEVDSYMHTDLASRLTKNVYQPLMDLAAYKRGHVKRMTSFGEHYLSLLQKAEADLDKANKNYVDCFIRYQENKDTYKLQSAYHVAHNEYLLQLKSFNQLSTEYYDMALPGLLQELEDIELDTGLALNGALESHVMLILSKSNEQYKRYEGILHLCKQLDPKVDIVHFVKHLKPQPFVIDSVLQEFRPPDPNSGNIENLLDDQLILNRGTQTVLDSKQSILEKQAANLLSEIQFQQESIATLTEECKKNIANHQYGKLYEIQEELCSKRNEVRIAKMQLAAIKPQIELLSPKQNGNMSSKAKEEKEASKPLHSAGSIKSMWKKAFKNLKRSSSTIEKTQTAAEKDVEKSTEDEQPEKEAGEPEVGRSTRLGSLRRSLMRKKPSKEEEEEDEQPANHEIDPVYSLLKCAGNLPKNKGHICGDSSCMMQHSPSGQHIYSRSNSAMSTGRTSPSSTLAVQQDQAYGGKRSPDHRRSSVSQPISHNLSFPEIYSEIQRERRKLMIEAHHQHSQSLTDSVGSLSGSEDAYKVDFSSSQQSRIRQRMDNQTKSFSLDSTLESDLESQHEQGSQENVKFKSYRSGSQEASRVLSAPYLEQSNYGGSRRPPMLNSRMKSQSADEKAVANLAGRRCSITRQDASVKPCGVSEIPAPGPLLGANGSRRRIPRLNERMKSFSIDVPDAAHVMSDPEISKRSNTLSPYHERKKFTDRTNSLDDPGYISVSQSSHSPSPHPSPPQSRRKSKLYLSLYNWRGSERGDLEIKAGWRIKAIETSDNNWWKGRCNGKVGYFPAKYVTAVEPDQKAYIVKQGLQLSEEGKDFKLLKDQIVVQAGSIKDGMVPVRSGDKQMPCPLKYLSEV